MRRFIKRFINVLLVFIFIGAVLFGIPETHNGIIQQVNGTIVDVDDILLGDVNDDGVVNILDANLVASHYNERIQLNDIQLIAADVNLDGEINVLDANLIAAHYNELIDLHAGPHKCQYIIETTPPTCTTNGYTRYTCMICGFVCRDNYANAVGHAYDAKTVAPTCLTDGYTTYMCSICGYVYNDNYINATGHDCITQTYEPTTTEEGYDLYVCYTCGYTYKDNYVDKIVSTDGYPKSYTDDTCRITIYREWHENAWVYAAHLEFTDYSRLFTECANGAYDNGYETTSHAAKRLDAVFAVNGCYSAPYLDYGVIRRGVVCNDKKYGYVAGYSYKSGLFGNLVADKYRGPSLTELAADGTVTDTFCFGPEFLRDGEVVASSDTSRAQRTFMGTNGSPGDVWVAVSDGRYNDGESTGLTYKQCAEYLLSKGCVYGIPLDGGGSSTMYFDGKVLNAAKNGQRAVVDFVVFK